MEHITLRIGPLPARIMRYIRPKHVVKDNEVGIAHAFGGLHEVAHSFGVGSNLGLRKDHA